MHRSKHQAGPSPRSFSGTCLSSALLTNSTESIAAPSWVESARSLLSSAAAGLPTSQLRHSSPLRELSPEVGDGANRKGGISWGCLTPPLLHRRSDMPCPTI